MEELPPAGRQAVRSIERVARASPKRARKRGDERGEGEGEGSHPRDSPQGCGWSPPPEQATRGGQYRSQDEGQSEAGYPPGACGAIASQRRRPRRWASAPRPERINQEHEQSADKRRCDRDDGAKLAGTAGQVGCGKRICPPASHKDKTSAEDHQGQAVGEGAEESPPVVVGCLPAKSARGATIGGVAPGAEPPRG
jgi:hypothetical protein